MSQRRRHSGFPPFPTSVSTSPFLLRPQIDRANNRYEAGISKALAMQPSAPALGIPPGPKGGSKGRGADSSGRESHAPSVAPGDRLDHLSVHGVVSNRPARLLTRLSLHGQGVRSIDGLQACSNLKVLVSAPGFAKVLMLSRSTPHE